MSGDKLVFGWVPVLLPETLMNPLTVNLLEPSKAKAGNASQHSLFQPHRTSDEHQRSMHFRQFFALLFAVLRILEIGMEDEPWDRSAASSRV